MLSLLTLIAAYMKLHNISVTLKIIERVVTLLDSHNASGSNGISVMVLKNYERQLSYISADNFEICLKKSCRLQSRFVRMLWKKLSIVCEIFENPVNNRLVDHLEELFFSDFQYCF